MNFVIASERYLPLADAEAYCTIRFASALAQAGHSVHVVTTEHPFEVSKSVMEKLTNPAVKVTVVPFQRPLKRPLFSQLRYRVADWEAVALPAFIKVLAQVLKSTENPILISRTYSFASLIAAWNCRKMARCWVAHLSDPIPRTGYHSGMSLVARMKCYFLRFWIRRAFCDANAVSVTCRNVIRFYREEYGSIVDRHPIFVTTHIGDTLLSDSSTSSGEPSSRIKTVIHQGQLFNNRGLIPMLEAIHRLNEAGTACRFLQVGKVKKNCWPLINNVPNVEVIDNVDPQKAAQSTRTADVVYVPDFPSDRSYSLWLMSKFVYTIYEDKPIVVLALQDSAKHDYATRFPEAGVFWADQAHPETLDAALKAAFCCTPSQINRQRIREEFSARKIADDFADNVKRLLR